MAIAPAVRVAGLSYHIIDRGKRQLDILRQTDLTIGTGEFVAIVGPSGCGKSTLLNVIAGLLPVQSGRVELFGAPIRGVHPAIGYMFQQHALLPWRTVLANVELGLELSGVPRHERQRRAAPCLAALGLQGFERHFPSELSGGMRQRVSLARLLVDAPQLILMDEPFGALDAQTRLLVQEMFLRIWEADRPTVMFVTHDLAEAIALADRVVVMSARPARIKQQYVVDIPRPRELDHLSKVPRFADLLESLWGDLRAEALVAMQGA